jgi:soluble lytic murein transglycosylase-like protein
LSATRIPAGLSVLAFIFTLSACTTGGIDMAAELEAVSQLAQVEADAENGAAMPEETAVIPAERPGDDAPIAVSAYAGPTPTGVQAIAAAAAAPGPRIIHPVANVTPRHVEPRSAELDALIARYANYYEVPVELVRRVVRKESTFNPTARNRIYWGLMQIRHDTAQTMGYRGPAEGLLDAETNLNYAVRYLRGAWLTAGGDQDRAVRHYQRGYYFHARDKGMLQVTGLRP